MVQKIHMRMDMDSQRLSMKVMANLGFPEFVPILAAMVKNMAVPMQMRIDAAVGMFDTVVAAPAGIEVCST